MKPEAAPSVKFTYEDFVNFPDDGKRHEIIDGEHYVTPSPSLKHQAIVANLIVSVATYLKANPIGFAVGSPLDVVFSELNVVEPDLQYISRERFDILTKQNVRGAPDLVVEILSPSTRRTDEITKRKLYERFGVQEYWVVDPDLDAVGRSYVRRAVPTVVRHRWRIRRAQSLESVAAAFPTAAPFPTARPGRLGPASA